jgi:hypothetical protein
MLEGKLYGKRLSTMGRLPGSPPQKLGSLAARVTAHLIIYGSYQLAYAVAYVREVRNAGWEGEDNQEPGRRA